MELVFLIFVIVVLAIVFKLAHVKAADEAWPEAARTLGLESSESGFLKPRRLEGDVRSLHVRVDTVRRGSGNSRRTYTRYRVAYPDLQLGLKLKKEGVLARVAGVLGAQDLELGDPEFDPHVVVKAGDPDAVRAFLTPARRREVVRVLEKRPGLVIEDRELEYLRRGLERNATELVGTVEELVGLGLLLGEERTRDPRAVEVEPQVEEPPPAEEPSHDEESHDAPLQDEEAPPDTQREEPAPGPEAEERVPGDEPADAAAVTARLFSGGSTGSEVRDRFEAELAGKRVRWRGRLERASKYYSDTVFGAGPGTRAVLLLAEVEEPPYGRREVHATLQLPEGTEATLRGRRGEELAFEGRLVHCDGFLRTLFVADARLV